MSGGYVKLHRRLADHWIWQRRPWNMGQLWAHLLMSANYHESTVGRGLRTITVKRGQVLTSIEKLSPTVGRDRKTIRAWLRAFALDGMLDIETDHGGDGGYTLLTIRNYETYQGSAQAPLDDVLPDALPDELDDELPRGLDDGLDDGLDPSKKLKKRKNRKETNTSGAHAPTDARLWLDLLNRETGADFKATPPNLSPIRARIREGYTLDQAEAVVKFLAHEWLGTKHAQYLRSITVFGPKFDGYLQAARNGDGHRVNDAWEGAQSGELDIFTGQLKGSGRHDSKT